MKKKEKKKKKKKKKVGGGWEVEAEKKEQKKKRENGVGGAASIVGGAQKNEKKRKKRKKRKKGGRVPDLPVASHPGGQDVMAWQVVYRVSVELRRLLILSFPFCRVGTGLASGFLWPVTRCGPR